MSIDYGDARTGIAFCDKNEILASAYTTINESYQPKLVKKIVEKATQYISRMVNDNGLKLSNPKKLLSVFLAIWTVATALGLTGAGSLPRHFRARPIFRLTLRTKGLLLSLPTTFCPKIMLGERNEKILLMLFRQLLFFKAI